MTIEKTDDFPMKDKLKITISGKDVVLSAHELLNLGIDILKNEYEDIIRHHSRFKRPYEGDPCSAETLSNRPKKWLYAASNLKQGLAREEVLKNKKISEQYAFEIAMKAIDYYGNKIKELTNEPIKEETKPVWDFWTNQIKMAVNELKKVDKDYPYEVLIVDAKERLNKINAYLLHITYMNLNVAKSDKISSEEDQKISDFLSLVQTAYKIQIEGEVKKEFIYYLRDRLVKDISSNDELIDLANKYSIKITKTEDKEKIFDELKKSCKDNIFSENFDEAIRACIGFIASHFGIPLNQGNNFISIASQLVKYVKGIPHEVKIIKTHISKDIKSFFETQNIKYFEACYTHETISLIRKRHELYLRYNTIFFIREIEYQKKFKFPDKEVSKIGKYIEIANKLLNDASQIQGPTKYFSFLKLLMKQGYQVQDIPSLATAGVMKGKHSSDLLSDMDCCMLCNFFDEVEKEHPELQLADSEDIKLEFYKIGQRVIAIQNHKDRYAFDIGETTDYFNADFKKVKKLKKGAIQEIHQFFKEIYKEGEDKIENLEPKNFIENLNEIFSSFAFRGLFLLAKQHFFSQIDIDTGKYCSSFTMFQSKFYALKKIEFEICRDVENFCRNLLLTLVRKSKKLADSELYIDSHKDDEIKPGKNTEGSYRGIFRQLPKANAGEIANVIRRLLQGEKVNQTDKNKILSLLTSTWFLSETSRNPVTLLVSLMLLDMIESQLTYGTDEHFTWDKILWHPHTISDFHPDGTDLNSMSSQERTKKYPQEDGWGGIHPMCHNGSYLNYFSKNKWPLGDVLEIVRQKEATLIIHWLYYMLKCYYPELQPEIAGIDSKIKTESVKQRDGLIFFKSYYIQKPHIASLDNQEALDKIIRPLFIQRLKTFKNLYAPPISPDYFFLKLKTDPRVNNLSKNTKENPKVPYTFLFKSDEKYHVTAACVRGSFNHWSDCIMIEKSKGVWEVTIELEPGEYEFKYYITHQTKSYINHQIKIFTHQDWVTDPSCQKSEHGYHNSILKVENPAHTVEHTFKLPIDSSENVASVHLAGTFNDWLFAENGVIKEGVRSNQYRMEKDEDGVWQLSVFLPEGKYEFQYVVNGGGYGCWYLDKTCEKHGTGEYTNSIIDTHSIQQVTEIVSKSEGSKKEEKSQYYDSPISQSLSNCESDFAINKSEEELKEDDVETAKRKADIAAYKRHGS